MHKNLNSVFHSFTNYKLCIFIGIYLDIFSGAQLDIQQGGGGNSSRVIPPPIRFLWGGKEIVYYTQP